MTEDIKCLIEKIQQEGVQAAEDKARDIESVAGQQAQVIIEKARKEAAGFIAKAKDEIARMQDSGRASLEQTARDLLLDLREEIKAVLDRIILSDVRRALPPQELSKIIAGLIESSGGKGPVGIIVELNKQDLEKIEKSFLSKLKDEIKKGITLKTSEDIHAGFLISYDSGSSHYDFTDRGLAEYIGLYLKPKLSQILKQAVSGGKDAQKSGR
ncbi:MAG: hypothetical protein NG712_01590 [Omnitrophica bacterium]|nr:hypothetical protein [Candidatus Omnitrophota bacterium]